MDNNSEHIILIMQNQIKSLKEKLELERDEHKTIYSRIKNENVFLINELYKIKNISNIYDQ